ncbi:uncharacterized protein DUF2835 [Halomonas alkaliantarctica]|nr:uncharacterized protein DUF2835 [Halomonas alkaliantarctica]
MQVFAVLDRYFSDTMALLCQPYLIANPMQTIDVVINLNYDECLAHYEGRIANVRTRSVDGRWVIFPAEAIRRVVSRDGVHGIYRLSFTEQGRFISINPLIGR